MTFVPDIERHRKALNDLAGETDYCSPSLMQIDYDKGTIYHSNYKKTRPLIMFPYEEMNPEHYESRGYKFILPMKAKDYNEDRHSDWWDKDTVACQMKHDGIRSTLHIRNYINRIFTGREVKNGWVGEKTDQLPHLRDYPMYNYRGTVLDGEIISPNGSNLADFKYTSGVLNSKPLKAVADQMNKGVLFFCAFDVVYYKGFYVGNCPYSFRFKLLLDILYTKEGRLRNPYIIPIFTVGASPVIIEGQKMDKRDYYEYLTTFDVEGIMLKDTAHMRYDGLPQDMKSSEQLKLKEIVELDMIGIGFTEANEGKTGQFKGLIGALQLGVYMKPEDAKAMKLKEVTEYTHLNGKKFKLDKVKGRVLVNLGKISGMNVPIRRDMTEHPEKYLNEVLRVKCNGVYKDTYVPRNPRFQWLHDQKNANQCTFEAHVEQSKSFKKGKK